MGSISLCCWALRLNRSALVLAFMAACAPISPRDAALNPQAIWEARQERISRLRDWSFNGRVAIRIEKEGWSAGLHWIQRDAGYTVRVTNPFGQGVYSVEGTPQGVTLRTAQHKAFSSPDGESLMREHLGWSIPLAGLGYWVRGIPDPRIAIEDLDVDDNGRLARLLQAGWHVEVQGYARTAQLELPMKLLMQHPRMRVRLAVERWNLSL